MRPFSREHWEKITLGAAEVGASSGEDEVINSYFADIQTSFGSCPVVADSKAELLFFIFTMLEHSEKGDVVIISIHKRDNQ